MDDTANEGAAIEKSGDIAQKENNTEPTETLMEAKEYESKKSANNSKKDSSLEEDLLGANSLLMSDSDDEAYYGASKANNQFSNIIQTENIKAIIEVNGETGVEVENKDSGKVPPSNSCTIKVRQEKNRKKISSILDSDSDVDENESKSTKISNNSKHLEQNNAENDESKVSKLVPQANHSPIKVLQKTNKKKFSSILDSDSDGENNEIKSLEFSKKNSKPARRKVSALIDTDSETDDEMKESFIDKETDNKNKNQVFDYDEKVTESLKSSLKNRKNKKVPSELIDSDSESNLDEASTHNESANETLDHEDLEMAKETKKQTQSKQMRASAKKALDDIQAIQSEQQRLHREAHISIPYHKPKRHTLQEFLKRRTIIKPGVDNECSPVVASLRQKSLKMTAEELEEYAKLMEDRAKEAKEFFKSESESEEEELKPNVGVLDLEKTLEEDKQTDSFLENEMEKSPTATQLTNGQGNQVDPVNKNIDTPIADNMEMELTSEDCPAKTTVIMNDAVETVVPNECNTQPIVTEVLELPRLDLSTFHISEEQSETNSSPSKTFQQDDNVSKADDIKTTIMKELQSTESPRLKGDANMLIDLDSGDLIAKKPTGADNLLQRLLATHKAKKTKVNETIDILSTENGKLEMTKVNFHHHDETEIQKEQKPGAAYLKLKENLKTLIKKKRLEELQKKQEDEDEYNKCLEGDDEDYDMEEDEEYEIENDKKVKMNKEKSNYDEIIIDEEENAVQLNDDENEDGSECEIDADEDEKFEADDEEYENKNDFIDEAAVKSASDKDNDSVSESNTDDDEVDKNEKELSKAVKEPVPTTQRKTRIIKPFTFDSDDEDDDDIDLLKTQIPIVAKNVTTPLFSVIDSPIKNSLNLSINSRGSDDNGNTQELLDLCSGTFDITQKPTETDATIAISQIPMSLPNSETETTRELLALCSGSFDNEQHQHTQQSNEPTSQHTQQSTEPRSQQEYSKTTTAYKILSSDEEEAVATRGPQNRRKKLSKKIKKGQTKLGFSDDENESDADFCANAESGTESENEIEDVAADDIPETYVEYDSEENEVIVELTKKDCIKRAGNFFEKEAELSESEWGSADEDENNLDQYDIELGDEDEFDREKLQQELGQIHARKMLDEDIREVRKIQEMLFEDEENDGVGRQRQFRWKNAESGFSLDDTNRGEDGGYIDAESGDEEQKQEHLWRKIRYEREQLLKEQGIKESSQELLTTKVGLNSPQTILTALMGKNAITKVIGNNGKKIQVVSKKTTLTTAAQQSRGSPFLISSSAKGASTSNATAMTTALTPKMLTNFTPPSKATILQPKAQRGSFLMRDKESLTKFANITKGIASSANAEDDETAGTVSIKLAKSKNFVFATLSKEEHEHLKRKADDLINSSSENGTNFMKKPRISNQNATASKHCFIDKLLS